MYWDDIYKKFLSLILLLNEEFVIVEGKRDKIALEEIGIESKTVFVYNNGIEGMIKQKPEIVVVLTDADEKGEELHHRIREILHTNNIECDEQARKNFFSIFRVKHVEAIGNEYEKLEKVIRSGKSLHRYSKIYDSREASYRRHCGKT